MNDHQTGRTSERWGNATLRVSTVGGIVMYRDHNGVACSIANLDKTHVDDLEHDSVSASDQPTTCVDEHLCRECNFTRHAECVGRCLNEPYGCSEPCGCYCNDGWSSTANPATSRPGGPAVTEIPDDMVQAAYDRLLDHDPWGFFPTDDAVRDALVAAAPTVDNMAFCARTREPECLYDGDGQPGRSCGPDCAGPHHMLIVGPALGDDR